MAIDRAGVHIRQVAVPNLIGILGKFDACSIKIIILIEESDLYSGRMRRGQGKIDASAIPRSAETMRQTLSRPVAGLTQGSRSRHRQIVQSPPP